MILGMESNGNNCSLNVLFYKSQILRRSAPVIHLHYQYVVIILIAS